MKRKIVMALLISIMSASLFSGCGLQKNGVDATAKKELTEALAELKANDGYLVQTVMEAPDGNATYLEVVNNGGSYTEIPLNEDGTIASTSITDEANTGNYGLADWLTIDGDMYMTYSDEDGATNFYELPKNYGKDMLSRNVGFFDEMLSDFTSIEKQEDTEIGNIGDGEEAFTFYKCKLPAETVKEILGMPTYSLYEECTKLKGVDENVKKLCEYYVEDLDTTLTFSDAEVLVAVADGKLSQLTMEIGGLGTKMYVTKTFLMNSEYEVRETPDFSKAVDYTTSLQEVADFVADYDSYDEAMQALNEQGNTEVTDETVSNETSETQTDTETSGTDTTEKSDSE